MQFAFGHAYDALDRPTMTQLPDEGQIWRTYDGAQPAGVYSLAKLTGGSVVADVIASELESHPSGGLEQMDLAAPVFPGQPLVRATYAYAPGDHRLASAMAIRDPNGGMPDVIQSLVYTHDTAGNLRRSDDLLGLLDQEFTYDALHRIESVAASGNAGSWGHGYTYDAAGNLLFKGPPGAAGELALLYDRGASTPTRLASVDRNLGGDQWTQNAGLYLVNADGGVTARTKDGALTTLWRNAEGSAQVVTNHATARSATYHYDPSGERSEKLVTGAWGVVHEARYSVDATFEVDTVNDTHEVHVFVGSRRVATSKRTGLGAGTPSDSVSQVTFYHPDQVGTNSVTTITTATSQSVSRAYLDPFGDKQAGTGGDPRHLFTDQERDAETGLDYFGARYYDAWVGRFLEQDPELLGTQVALLRSGESDARFLSAYSYALNSPTLYIDPNGREPRQAKTAGQRVVDEVSQRFAGGADPRLLDALASIIDFILAQPSSQTASAQATGSSSADNAATPALPDEAWSRNAPDQAKPGVTISHDKFNPRTGENENSTATYDEYGRQSGRTDWTDHGFPNEHTNPHHHSREYGPGYSPKGKESGPKPGPHPGHSREKPDSNSGRKPSTSNMSMGPGPTSSNGTTGTEINCSSNCTSFLYP